MKKIARQRKALERFRIMPFNEWCEVHKYTFTEEEKGSLGYILCAGLHRAYEVRKGIEIASLQASLKIA